MKHIEVVAAILVCNNRILCAQRNVAKYDYISYKFEFPGGKLESGETPKEALHRELIEEMDLDVEMEQMKFFHTVNHQYPDFEITMHSFICYIEKCEINLKEHIAVEWRNLEKLDLLDWVVADLPIVQKLIREGLQE